MCILPKHDFGRIQRLGTPKYGGVVKSRPTLGVSLLIKMRCFWHFSAFWGYFSRFWARSIKKVGRFWLVLKVVFSPQLAYTRSDLCGPDRPFGGAPKWPRRRLLITTPVAHICHPPIWGGPAPLENHDFRYLSIVRQKLYLNKKWEKITFFAFLRKNTQKRPKCENSLGRSQIEFLDTPFCDVRDRTISVCVKKVVSSRTLAACFFHKNVMCFARWARKIFHKNFKTDYCTATKFYVYENWFQKFCALKVLRTDLRQWEKFFQKHAHEKIYQQTFHGLSSCGVFFHARVQLFVSMHVIILVSVVAMRAWSCCQKITYSRL